MNNSVKRLQGPSEFPEKGHDKDTLWSYCEESSRTHSIDAASELVSVVIPTRNRVALLKRAIASALSQSYGTIEVIVIIDGQDPVTEGFLRSISDPRLRHVSLSERAGGSEARNVGVRAAVGDWVAFLDDDDSWMPTKIEKQIALARTIKSRNAVIGCKVIGRYPDQDYLWPTRTPRPQEPICEYLFNRKAWFRGEGQLQTSMLFVSRELMLKIPFTAGLPKHQDTDWWIRADADTTTMFLFVEEPLAVWYLGEQRDSIVRHYDWEQSWRWLIGVRRLLTKKSFAGFIATQLVGEAAAQGRSFTAGPFLLWHMITLGRPGIMECTLFFGNCILKPSIRGRLRRMFSRDRVTSDPSNEALRAL